MPRSGFTLTRPDALTSSVICASPHSGRDYTWSFMRRSALSELTMRSSEDAFVDQLIEETPRFGAPLLTATVPRAFVDLNRSADELDPALIDGVQKAGHNPRVASGLGVIPRVVANSRAIYRGKLSHVEARKRLTDYWFPYHDQLARLLGEAHENFGTALLLDFHSMPREALDSVVRASKDRPDVVLGDRFGASANSDVMDFVEAAFASAGFKVSRNTPFAGAYVTQTYGRPSREQNAIQIEIDRSIYMNEETMTHNSNFADVKQALTTVISDVCKMHRGSSLPVAAE